MYVYLHQMCKFVPRYFNDGGGGVLQRFIFYTQKISTSEFVYPKKSLPCVIHRPKKIPFDLNFRPKNVPWIPLSVKCESGAPGTQKHWYLPIHQLIQLFKARQVECTMLSARTQHSGLIGVKLTTLECNQTSLAIYAHSVNS